MSVIKSKIVGKNSLFEFRVIHNNFIILFGKHLRHLIKRILHAPNSVIESEMRFKVSVNLECITQCKSSYPRTGLIHAILFVSIRLMRSANGQIARYVPSNINCLAVGLDELDKFVITLSV